MDNLEKLHTIVESQDSQHMILAPTVGYYSELPLTGTFLSGGSFVGRLKVLNQIIALYLPDNVQGQVESMDNTDEIIPVEYRQKLFCLSRGNDLTMMTDKMTADHPNDTDDMAESGFQIKAFTTGIFYAKPAPDSPPFVSEGEIIEKGKAVGLIEVMKTFNHVIFTGTETSSTARIKKIYVKDSQEVKQGQALFLVE